MFKLLTSICLLTLIACADSNKVSTGGGNEVQPVPAIVEQARGLLHPHYEDAATHPVVMREWGKNYARYDHVDGVIVLTSYWSAKAKSDLRWGAGVIAHEWFHSTQDPWGDIDLNEREARAFQREVLTVI